jgi:hypothetical protein
MKQKKAEKKQQRGKFGQNEFDQNSNGGDNDADSGSDLNRVIPLPDLEIKVRDTIPRKEAPTRFVRIIFPLAKNKEKQKNWFNSRIFVNTWTES